MFTLGCSNTWGTTGINTWSAAFSSINDLPQITNVNSKLVLFADDTSVIITNPGPLNYRTNLNKITHDIKKWFETNLLSLNLDKTHCMQFMAKNNPPDDFDIMHGSKKNYHG